jgi:hypothetical protein
MILKKAFMILLFVFLFETHAFSDEVKLEVANLSLELPKAWMYKTVENAVTPTQKIKRWIREPVKHNNIDFFPGIAVRASALEEAPIPEEYRLLPALSELLLKQAPYMVQLVDTDCLKCVQYQVKNETGSFSAFSDSVPPDCESISNSHPDSVCVYEIVNKYGFDIEPSWIFGFQKDAGGNPLDVVLIHLIKDEKLVEISFWYPSALADMIDPEVSEIIHSIKAY